MVLGICVLCVCMALTGQYDYDHRSGHRLCKGRTHHTACNYTDMAPPGVSGTSTLVSSIKGEHCKKG